MINMSIDIAPLIPMPLFWAAIAFAVALIFIMLLRGIRGAALRALALAALIAALANPTLQEEQRENLGNIAIVIVDESTSQTLAQRPAETAAIRRQLEARLGQFPELDVRWAVSSRPRENVKAGTTLFEDLNEALSDIPPDRLAGVFMITDGQVHDVPAHLAQLGFEAPVHVLLTGRKGEFDRRIEVIEAPRYGIVGQTRDIEIALYQSGNVPAGAASRVQIKVRREGEADEIYSARIGGRLRLPMLFRHAGQNIVEIELPETRGELTTANNRVAIIADGVRENLRVLLVSGKPHVGERTWRNLLKSDAAVDLVHFTILRPPQKQDGTPIDQLSLIAFPTRELFSQKIEEFDLIVLDRYQHRRILQSHYYDNIALYVERHGGALLVAAGNDYVGHDSIAETSLKWVLPAQPTGSVLTEPFRPRLTKLGARHPVTQGLPGGDMENPTWGRWFRQVEVAQDRGQTLMNGVGEKPLLILERRGAGRVALLTSDHAWLWARSFDGGGPHTQLLRRLAHWLMREPDLEEERLRVAANGLKLVVERRTMGDLVPDVAVSGPSGEESTIALSKVRDGLWQAAITARQAGVYKFETPSSTGRLTAIAHAGIADPREMSEVTATEKKLADLIDKTGGGIFWTQASGALNKAAGGAGVTVPRLTMLSAARVFAGSNWMALKDRNAYLTRGVKLTPLFSGFAALAALLFLMFLAWWREGRS